MSLAEQVGIGEDSGSYHSSLGQVGKEKDGQTIGISYFSGQVLRIVRPILFLAGLLLLIGMLGVQHPFGWIPVSFDSPEWVVKIHDFALFKTLNWIIIVLGYLVVGIVGYVWSNMYTGKPGMVQHMTRHSQMIAQIEAGNWRAFFDWRVRAYAVVSTKPMMAEMPPVEGYSRDNINMKYNSGLIFRVINSHRLLEMGGFEKFFAQLLPRWEAAIKQAMLRAEAKNFASFMVTPVVVPAAVGKSITEKLSGVAQGELSLELLSDIAEIGEIDISKIDLTEGQSPERKMVLSSFQDLATDYGIELLDSIPLGGATSEEYLKTLATPLVSSVERLRQATAVLKSIIEDEIDEKIRSEVAKKSLAVLSVDRILKELASITATLQDPSRRQEIVMMKRTQMENVIEGHIASILGSIEGLLAQIKGTEINAAGTEIWVAQMEEIISDLEDRLEELVPSVGNIITQDFGPMIMPDIDILGRYLSRSKTDEVLAALEEDMPTPKRVQELEGEIQRISEEAQGITVAQEITSIEKVLAQITTDSGVTVPWTVESVGETIDKISSEAGVAVTDEKGGENEKG